MSRDIGSVLVTVVELLATLWSAHLFFKKARVFPNFIVILTLLEMTASVISWVVLRSQGVTTESDMAILIAQTIVDVLWTGYFIRSKRVKGTFTNNISLVPFKKVS